MNLKVLIIEDDSFIALQIKSLLISMDCTCVGIANNSKDAIDIANNNKINLIISDINILGDIDGIDTSRIIQDKFFVDVLFLTAYKDINTLNKASNINFVGYLLKPFRQDELESIINIQKYKYIKHNMIIINHEYKYCGDTEELLLNGEKIHLTKKEVLLVKILINKKNELISHDQLDLFIWDNDFVSENSRRQLIYRFKEKAKDFPLFLIKGSGYKLVINNE